MTISAETTALEATTVLPRARLVTTPTTGERP
jgi:hypothetical protein